MEIDKPRLNTYPNAGIGSDEIGIDGYSTNIHGYETIGKAPAIEGDINFQNSADGTALLKIAPDGFYVRGEKLPQDDCEAKAVYDAFIAWLKTTNK